jgi:hypothetical protein
MGKLTLLLRFDRVVARLSASMASEGTSMGAPGKKLTASAERVGVRRYRGIPGVPEILLYRLPPKPQSVSAEAVVWLRRAMVPATLTSRSRAARPEPRLVCLGALTKATVFSKHDAPSGLGGQGRISTREEDPMSTGFRITITKSVSGITITIEPW